MGDWPNVLRGAVVAFVAGGLALLGAIWAWIRRREELQSIKLVLPLDERSLSFREYLTNGRRISGLSIFIARSFVKMTPKDNIDPNRRISSRIYNHLAEVESIVKLTSLLTKYKINFTHQAHLGTSGTSNISRYEFRHDNLLIIGGDSYNDDVRYNAIKTALQSKFGLQKVNRARNRNCDHYNLKYGNYNLNFKCKHDENDYEDYSVEYDVGFICRFHHEGTQYLMCRGIHSFASAAALDLVFNENFRAKVLRENAKEFIQFVRVDVARGLYVSSRAILWAGDGYPFIATEHYPKRVSRR